MTVFTPLWGYWAWRERSLSKSNKNTQSGVKKGSTYIIIVPKHQEYGNSSLPAYRIPLLVPRQDDVADRDERVSGFGVGRRPANGVDGALRVEAR